MGYVYQQLTGDSGSGATLGDFKSRVAGIGPQVGYFFERWDRKWYVNVKGYYEFAAENRADGWNVWLTYPAEPRPEVSGTSGVRHPNPNDFGHAEPPDGN